MVLVCPHCAKESTDTEFCDFCNRELNDPTLRDQRAPIEVRLADGSTLDCSFWKGTWPNDPDASCVAAVGDRSFRVHGVAPSLWAEVREMAVERAGMKLAILPKTEIVDVDNGGIVIAENDWQAAIVPKPTVSRGYKGDWLVALRSLIELCIPFQRAIRGLSQAGLVWLTFDPSALECRDENVRVTNLDWRVFHEGKCPPTLKISPKFSPPEVCRFLADKIGPATDVYHLALISYYWLADMPNGFCGEGLGSFCHSIPALRLFQSDLPPGIAPIIERGLAIEPNRRQASVDDFLGELIAAVDRVEQRCRPVSIITKSRRGRWGWLWPPNWLGSHRRELHSHQDGAEIGGICIAGRAKEALSAINQDAIAFGRLKGHSRASRDHQESAFMVVADGVTHAKAGSGDLASHLACDKLKSIFETYTLAIDDIAFEALVTEVLVDASKNIVTQALSVRDEAIVLTDADLMSSTAVVAVLNGRRLHVANVGDSRVYLVASHFIEQLTVDGDVSSAALAEDVPPEQVLDMGNQAKALRFCLGAAMRNDRDGFMPDIARCQPQLSHWTLLPDDIILVCSDGLIDEGIFLDPGDAEAIVRSFRDQSSQKIAEQLVDAANARQRLASDAEPQGFGDNISCLVLKILTPPIQE